MTAQTMRHIKQKQYLACLALLLAVSLATSFGFHLLNGSKVLYRHAETLFDQGAYDLAIPLYEKALGAGLDNDRAAFHLFEAYLRLHREHQATSAFEQLSDRLRSPGAVVALAGVYAATKRWQEAIDVFMRYPGIWSRSPAAMMNLADLHRNKADLKAAEHWYRQALSASPDSVYARFRLAETLSWSRHYDESIRLLDSILDENPRHRLARLYLARVLTWSGRPEEAIAQYQILLGEKP